MQGQLIMWNPARGFGFVQPDGTTEISDRFFVHVSNFGDDRKNIKLGVRISFTVGDPISIGKKPQATKAKVLDVPAATVATTVATVPVDGLAVLGGVQ